MFIRTRVLAVAATLATAVVLTAAAPALAQQNRISITTGGTGGVYYPLGGGMAQVLSKYIPGLSATAEVTGASVAPRQRPWRTSAANPRSFARAASTSGMTLRPSTLNSA